MSDAEDRLTVIFDRWDAESYQRFLRTKKLPEYRLVYDWEADRYILSTPRRFASIIGEQAETAQAPTVLAPHLFDYQAFLTWIALDTRHYACWADTGLGKTEIGLEFARQAALRTGQRVLIIAPLNIVAQWIQEVARWYPDMAIACPRTGAELLEWCEGPRDGSLGITNPEKLLGHGERVTALSALGGVVLDEASILKSGGGKIKWTLIKSAKGLEYKLSLTATPAPNDTMEYASQGSFLEKLRHEGEILWTFFRRDKEGNWYVKDHAREAFYRFMSGWSCYLRHPARYGFADNLKDIPDPEYRIRRLPMTVEQVQAMQELPDAEGQINLFGANSLGIVARSKLSQIAKGFIYGRGQKVGRLIMSVKPLEVANIVRADLEENRQVIVWTVFDAESDILAALLADIEGMQVLTGKVPLKKRQPIIEGFRTGQVPLLITRASILGHGLNFQACTSMVFSGFDDSFERFYQAVRRAVRYGQRRQVRIHVPYIPELEGTVWENIQAKSERFEHDTRVMEDHYKLAMKERLPHGNAA
jgi:hypothetical protein